MARALDRFRVLPLPDAPGPARADQQDGDLFEHFGVPLEPRAPTGPRPLVEVRACGVCGWWLDVDTTDPCPICGGSSPPS